jgi:hypothetical protein
MHNTIKILQIDSFPYIVIHESSDKGYKFEHLCVLLYEMN